jgi:hypothetical protein
MGGNVFARAYAGLNLTPFERGALRLLEGIGASAFIAGVTAAVPYLAGGTVNWGTVGHVFVAAAGTALCLALLKYLRAWGDPILAPPLPPDAGGPEAPGAALGPVSVSVSIPPSPSVARVANVGASAAEGA